MKAIKLSRKIHKWAALVLGVQVLILALTGFYMSAIHLDIIHGDMLVKNMAQHVRPDADFALSLDQLSSVYPDVESITLTAMLGRPVYQILGANRVLVDARNGMQISPLDEETAIAVALYHYAGEGPIENVELLESDPPIELRLSAPLPLWRVDFDDVWNTTFWIDPATGELATRRHTLWRVFDFFQTLHFMSYDERGNRNNAVLQVYSVLGTVFSLSGVWLLFYSFGRKSKLGKPAQ